MRARLKSGLRVKGVNMSNGGVEPGDERSEDTGLGYVSDVCSEQQAEDCWARLSRIASDMWRLDEETLSSCPPLLRSNMLNADWVVNRPGGDFPDSLMQLLRNLRACPEDDPRFSSAPAVVRAIWGECDSSRHTITESDLCRAARCVLSPLWFSVVRDCPESDHRFWASLICELPPSIDGIQSVGYDDAHVIFSSADTPFRLLAELKPNPNFGLEDVSAGAVNYVILNARVERDISYEQTRDNLYNSDVNTNECTRLRRLAWLRQFWSELLVIEECTTGPSGAFGLVCSASQHNFISFNYADIARVVGGPYVASVGLSEQVDSAKWMPYECFIWFFCLLQSVLARCEDPSGHAELSVVFSEFRRRFRPLPVQAEREFRHLSRMCRQNMGAETYLDVVYAIEASRESHRASLRPRSLPLGDQRQLATVIGVDLAGSHLDYSYMSVISSDIDWQRVRSMPPADPRLGGRLGPALHAARYGVHDTSVEPTQPNANLSSEGMYELDNPRRYVTEIGSRNRYRIPERVEPSRQLFVSRETIDSHPDAVYNPLWPVNLQSGPFYRGLACAAVQQVILWAVGLSISPSELESLCRYWMENLDFQRNGYLLDAWGSALRSLFGMADDKRDSELLPSARFMIPSFVPLHNRTRRILSDVYRYGVLTDGPGLDAFDVWCAQRYMSSGRGHIFVADRVKHAALTNWLRCISDLFIPGGAHHERSAITTLGRISPENGCALLTMLDLVHYAARMVQSGSYAIAGSIFTLHMPDSDGARDRYLCYQDYAVRHGLIQAFTTQVCPPVLDDRYASSVNAYRSLQGAALLSSLGARLVSEDRIWDSSFSVRQNLTHATDSRPVPASSSPQSDDATGGFVQHAIRRVNPIRTEE